MPLTIGNTAAANTANNVGDNQRLLEIIMEHLSSGQRINSASDDAAGLAIADSMSVEQSSNSQAIRNANDAISTSEIADGATSAVSDSLGRMRELAVQAASETLGTAERQYAADEFAALSDEVNRIAGVTEFNGTSLSDGTLTSLSVQVGASTGAQASVPLADMRSSTLGVDAASVDISSATGAQAAIGAIDAAMDTVNGYRSSLGASASVMESQISYLEDQNVINAQAESRIRDADMAEEISKMAGAQIRASAGISILAQANNLSQNVLTLLDN